MSKKFFYFFVSIAIMHACAPAAFSANLITGEEAPEFNLISADGHNRSLSDFRGKYVILEWFNYDCPFVKKHYDSQNMQRLQRKYTGKDVTWLSINSSAPGKQGHYAPGTMKELARDRKAAPTDILLDPAGKVGRMYGAKTTPHMYIVDPKGILIYQGAIDSIPSANPADIPGALNYVDLAMNQALGGDALEHTQTKPYGCSVKY